MDPTLVLSSVALLLPPGQTPTQVDRVPPPVVIQVDLVPQYPRGVPPEHPFFKISPTDCHPLAHQVLEDTPSIICFRSTDAH